MGTPTPDPSPGEAARTVGAMLRGLRREAGYASVSDAAATPGCPAAVQTIYGYERGSTIPSLRQFCDLVEFYALRSPPAGAERAEGLRYRAVAAVTRALALPEFHVAPAIDLIGRLQPEPAEGRRRRSTRAQEEPR